MSKGKGTRTKVLVIREDIKKKFHTSWTTLADLGDSHPPMWGALYPKEVIVGEVRTFDGFYKVVSNSKNLEEVRRTAALKCSSNPFLVQGYAFKDLRNGDYALM